MYYYDLPECERPRRERGVPLYFEGSPPPGPFVPGPCPALPPDARTPEALVHHRQICRDIAADWHKYQQRPGASSPR